MSLLDRSAVLAAILSLITISAGAVEVRVAPDGPVGGDGTGESPQDFRSAVDAVSAKLKKSGVPEGGVTVTVGGGRYSFDRPFVLGPEFAGTAERPIVIRAEGEVVFDGSKRIAPDAFAPVSDPAERSRLAVSAADRIVAATITDEALISKLRGDLMLNLTIDGTAYLPAVFPNEGYAKMKTGTVTPEVAPPAVPVGKQGYGIRAGNPPHQEPGKPQGWKGTLSDPRGARAGFADKEGEMAGSWEQWERELGRDNTRNQLTGFIEANWLLSSQPIHAASGKDRCLHLSRALSYGWAWRKDKPFRVFGMLCELDRPGEWHFDSKTNRLFICPPQPITADTVISLPVAAGFMTLDGATHVSVIGLSVRNVGSGSVYHITRGHHNLVASCAVSDCTATGLNIGGTRNAARGCDLFDLNRHVSLGGGRRSPTEITPGHNLVANCHIYQKKIRHEKVNIGLSGVGNAFSANLVHNSLGQAMTIGGNGHVIQLNEFFNVGYDEGDGGAMYAGADLTGYGIVYRHNFFHHLMHVPGKVERSGIHLDDLQAGSTCIGNIFYKSAAKGIFMNGGAGHVLRDNVFLEGFRGIYNVGAGAQKNHDRQEGALKDPNHPYRNTKENYVGRAEKIVGKRGWSNPPWSTTYPLFNQVMSDTGQYGRMWPIRCEVVNNFYYKNTRNNRTEWSRVAPEAMNKSVIRDDRDITPDDFVDYNSLDLRFKTPGLAEIPFEDIGLQLSEYRAEMPDKRSYRTAIKEFYQGIGSMPGTTKKIDTAKIVEEGPVVKRD